MRAATWKATHDRLDGGACLNKRTIETACALFDSTRPPANEEIEFAELMEALWFLELSIVSNNLTYDGTLPQHDIDTLSAQVEAIAAQIDLRDGEISPIRPKTSAEKRWFMRAAAQQGQIDLQPQTAPRHVRSGLDRAFDADAATEFFMHLRRIRASLDGNRNEITEERLEFLAGDRPVRGGKCLAGLGLLGREAVDSALGLPEALAIRPGLAMAVLINRFRFSYVRQLAFGVRDVYVPASRWRALSEVHALTFAEVVRRSLESKLTEDLQEELEERFGEDNEDGDPALLSLPPIGLYALMTAPDNAKPHDVAREARAEFAEYGRLFRHFWRNTRKVRPPAGGWTALVGDDKLDTEHERIERELSDLLGKLRNPRAGNASVVDRFLAPVIVSVAGAASGLASYLLAPESDSAVAAAQVGALGAAVGGMVAGSGKSLGIRLSGHVDEYRKLEGILRGSQADLRFARLEQQVRRIFGRKLVLRGA